MSCTFFSVPQCNYSKLETIITSLNPQPDIISVTETWLIEQSGPCHTLPT